VDVDPYDKKAHRPECLCRVECDEACLNRAMFYECDDQNCALEDSADCSNRAFQRAAVRYADHNARSCGFEVFDVRRWRRVDSRLLIVGLACVYCETSNRIR
jgi:AWS domain